MRAIISSLPTLACSTNYKFVQSVRTVYTDSANLSKASDYESQSNSPLIVTTNSCGLTSIENSRVKSWVNIYPNPSNGFFNVEFSAESRSKEYDIGVFDLTGRSIFSRVVPADRFSYSESIDLTYVEKGIYFVKVIPELGPAVIQRIVVQ